MKIYLRILNPQRIFIPQASLRFYNSALPKVNKDSKELTRFVDSVIMLEYPIIDDFVNKIFKLGYD